MKDRRAFTLIEVLVVVGIIALLAAILVPTLSRAKLQARRVTCASQLHQVGIAMIGYMGDNRDRMPWVSAMPSFGPAPCTTEKPIYLADVLARNLKGQKDTLKCPDDVFDNQFYDARGASSTVSPNARGAITRDAPNTGLTYFQSERSSYEYRVQLANLSPKEFNQPPVYLPSTIAQHWRQHRSQDRKVAPETVWFARDFENFHGKAGQIGARRYVYIDGHVADYEN